MNKLLQAVSVGVCLVNVLGVVACGGHSAAPTAPSAAAPSGPASSPAPGAPGATISGIVTGTSPAGMVVAVAGTSTSAPADGGGRFNLTNVQPAEVVLTFTAPGVSASAPVGSVTVSDVVEVAVTVSGSTATVDAQQTTAADNSIVANGTLSDLDVAGRQFRIGSTVVLVPTSAVVKRADVAVDFAALKNGDRVYVRGMKEGSVVRASEVLAVGVGPATPDVPVTANGAIGNLGGSCPALSMTVGGTVVKTNSATVFDGGRGCSALANGDAVSVAGIKQSDGSVLASKVTYTAPPTPEDVTLNGVVAGLGGSCPALTLTVAGAPARTNAATAFNNRACIELRNGDTVYAIGPKQGDGSVLASKIYYVSSPSTEVTLTGTVSGFGGAWPVLTFTVQGTAVKTSSATTCDGTKGCSVMANGDSVTVVGVKQSDGTVLASKVTNTTAPPSDVTLNGAIAGLGGACPALSFTVTGTPVKTNAATVFPNRACAEFRNGDVVYAIGPKQSDGSILASKVYYSPTTETVTLSGTVAGFAGTCPAISMTVSGTSVKTTSATTFDGTKGCSVTANGDSVTVVGVKQSDGTVLASKVTNATAPPADVYVNGAIVGLSGVCPIVSMTLSGTPVKTTSTTAFNGRACAELKNGDVIYAAGPKQADGSVLANRTFYTEPTVTLTGTVSNFGGAWPVLTFTVQGTAVKTSSSTTCDGTKGCSAMANGDSVTVVGTKQSDGTVVASKVTNATAPPPADVTLNGLIAGLGGTCPALTMTVAGGAVKTTSSTVFSNKGCTELKNGDTVYAIGPKQSDGTVLASKVYFVVK